MARVLVLFVACALLLWTIFSWAFRDLVIDSGEFQGIRIGSTKQDVFEAIAMLPSVASVSGIYKDRGALGHAQMASVYDHVPPDRLYLIDGDARLILDFENGRLESIKGGSIYQVDLRIAEGAPWREAKGEILRYLQLHPKAYVLPSIVGFGIDESNFEVALSGSQESAEEGMAWLMNQAIWGFHYTDSFSYTELTFQDDVLVMIMHRQRRYEWPW